MNIARGAASPNPRGTTAAARTFPCRTSSSASASETSFKSNDESAFIAATIDFETGLASRSTIATGTREGVFGGPPMTAPKKPAMRIGAARVISTARLLEK
jgi:hypothetical protein